VISANVGDIKSLELAELGSWLTTVGEAPYRAKQIMHWLYQRQATEWSVMTNLRRDLQARLNHRYSLGTLKLVARQGAPDQTQKFLWQLTDGALIESVLIPANPALFGDPSDRHTLCVSTQVGCAYGCRFCASGLAGWKRNLEPFEIVEQVQATERWAASQQNESPATGPCWRTDPLVNNLVIMGMGEPLANYHQLMKALRILNAPWGGRIGARKITISTSGLAPQIRQLAQEPYQFRLAISLHAVTDEIRNRLMPVNRKYPLRELTSACEEYLARKGRMITLEYVLIAGVNDGLDQVPALAALAKRLHAHVNLIPYNPVAGLDWERPAEPRQRAFWKRLEDHRVQVTLRHEKGGAIDAACGQLRLQTERALKIDSSSSILPA
jgi:23S rRNA (adenine2503-C2)-methyltransferase